MQHHWPHIRSSAQRWGRRVLSLVLALLILAPTPAWAQTRSITDVPTDHWAYAAVRRLVDEGYLTLADDRTFRGDQPVDRYTFAAAIARVLDQVAAGSSSLSREAEDTLIKLATEFRQELVDWQAAREELERRTAALDTELQALTAAGGPVDLLLARVRSLEEAAAMRDADLALLSQQLGELSVGLADLNESLGLQTGTLDQRLAEFQNQIEGDLGVQGINLGQSLADLAARLQETSDRLAQQTERATELQRQLEQQRQEMTGADAQLLAEIRELANRLDVLQSTPGTVAGVQTRQIQLERQLASLQRDFDAYRLRAEEETRSLRTTSMVGAAAALVAIVAALVVNK